MSSPRLATLLFALALASCGAPQALEVRPYLLRTTENEVIEDPLILAERNRRFHGAIGIREQEQRLGHYYTILWHDPSAGQPVEVRFEYQQAATASKILRKSATFPGSDTRGRTEFQIIGDDYLKGGRVLAWKATLLRGDREISHRQSYLWR